MTLLILIALGILAGYLVNKYYLKPNAELAKIFRALSGIGIPKTECKFKYDYVTPKGVPVKSVVQVPAEALQLIDAGISVQIARYTQVFPNWNFGKTFGEYRVLFVEPRGVTVENDPGAPLIYVNGTSAAGATIGMEPGNLSPVDRPMMVIPHQEKQNWSHKEFLLNTATAESEHTPEET
jgi:hypothetical protein